MMRVLVLMLAVLWTGPVSAGKTPAEKCEQHWINGKNRAALRTALRHQRKLFKQVEKGEIDSRTLQVEDARKLVASATYYVILEAPTIPKLQSYLSSYADVPEARKVREALQGLATEHAEAYPSESVFQGIARDDPSGVVLGNASKAAYDRAADLAFTKVTNGGTAIALRSFQLRYPNTIYTEAMGQMESTLSFMEAKEQGSVAAWSDFVQRYPNHPRVDEARKALRDASWSALSIEADSRAKKWNYAAEFPDTAEGWDAAVQALKEDAEWHFQANGQTLDGVGESLTERFDALILDLGGPLPSGYEVDLDLSVQIDSIWMPWPAAAKTIATRIGIQSPLPEDGLSSVFRERSKVSWQTELSVCAPGTTPLPIRACASMSSAGRKAQACTQPQTSAVCDGARKLVFLAHADDISGPFMGVQFRPETGKWDRFEPGVKLHADWDCTHIAAQDEHGLEAICGPVSVRIGWEEGAFWIRKQPDDVAMTDRISLEPWTGGKEYPFKLSSRTASKAKVLDSKGRTLDLQQGRDVVLTPGQPAHAFGLAQPEKDGAPQLSAMLERPDPGGVIIPSNAYLVETKPIPRPSSVTAVLEGMSGLLGDSMPNNRTIQLSIVPDAPPVTATLLANDSGIGLLIAEPNASESEEWHRILLFPFTSTSRQLPSWSVFEVEGHTYLRVTGARPGGGGTRLVTVRWDGHTYVFDVLDMGR